MTDTTLRIINSRPVLKITAPGPQGAKGAGIKVLGELPDVGSLPPTSTSPETPTSSAACFMSIQPVEDGQNSHS